MTLMYDYNIREGSWIARIASLKLRSRKVAIVIGKTIHLTGTSTQEFIDNKRWLKHELCHITQFKEHGFFRFIFMYVWESLKNGYYNNKYEREAREAEKDTEGSLPLTANYLHQ